MIFLKVGRTGSRIPIKQFINKNLNSYMESKYEPDFEVKPVMSKMMSRTTLDKVLDESDNISKIDCQVKPNSSIHNSISSLIPFH